MMDLQNDGPLGSTVSIYDFELPEEDITKLGDTVFTVATDPASSAPRGGEMTLTVGLDPDLQQQMDLQQQIELQQQMERERLMAMNTQPGMNNMMG